jgi:hypothetical protein
MTQEHPKISRRKALKIITAAAGAATLANLPNKWVKPISNAGVLPAHAQTSTLPLYSFADAAITVVDIQPTSVPDEVFSNDILHSTATITPVAAGIQIRRTISILDATHPSYGSPDVSVGPTDGSGMYTGPDFDLFTWNEQQYIGSQEIRFLWEFVNPADGTDTWTETVYIIE